MANKQTIIGKTAPVPLGQQKAVNSLPVVFAEDQPPIPVEEQNKIQSEVALSLLGIPRAEVALGIFADVNTYDVNPSEWSQIPLANDPETGTGVNHLAQEAGAELVASEGRTTVLTSKRFFRYQPGRVSSSTMGVKMNRTLSTYDPDTPNRDIMKGAPTIKKWGIFDKFDGYYFEIVNSGDSNDFRCVRRTQALTPSQPAGIGNTTGGWAAYDSGAQGKSNISGGNWGVVGVDPVIYRNGLCYVAAAIYDPSLCYAPADVRAIEITPSTLSDYNPDSNYAVRLAYKDGDNNFVEHMSGRRFQFPFDQREPDTYTTNEYDAWETNGEFLTRSASDGGQYIRLDAHCKWQDIVTNLTRQGSETANGPTAPDQWGIDSGTGLITYNSVTPDASNVSLSTGTGILGYDQNPSHISSGIKVWNLLVTVQGSTQVGNGDFDNAFGTDSHRSPGKEYDTDSSDPGTKNLTLKEWFKICVPPQYRTVYEWRPVRAMFSNDQLNGEAGNKVRWSDVSTATVDPAVTGVKRPGDTVFVNNQELTTNSAYDVDFSKVTMWKIDFSWYGAVGALFLCYVPVSNGEARWVRVHHMRASNQLDVASLGNATLPITYLTHSGLSSGLPDGKSTLVKYGASYYIDGGDKGTVKLLSKSSDYAKKVSYSGLITGVVSASGNSLVITFTQSDKDQLIGSYLKSDTTTKVIWVSNGSTGQVQLFFNKDVSGLSGNVEIVIPRRQRAMMALRAKDEVTNTTGTPIRNRIQLYPIKYGIGVTDPSSESNIVTVNFIKNPLLITNNLNNSALSQSYDVSPYNAGESPTPNLGLTLGSGVIPLKLESGTNISGTGYTNISGLLPNNGDYIHCYIRGFATSSVPPGGFDATPDSQEFPALVRFFKKAGSIYIQNYSAQDFSVNVFGPIIPVRMYQFNIDGTMTRFNGEFTHSDYEDQKKWEDKTGSNPPHAGSFESIAQLSGASVSQDFRLSPVSGTGSTLFSLYTGPGGSQYDLTDYFAYNKEYISYPLTNEVDILCAYAMWESTSEVSQPITQLSIVNSLTWEEQ